MSGSSLSDIEFRVSETVRLTLNNLNAIWDEVGIVGESRKMREDVVHNHIENLLSQMEEEEEATKKRMFSNVERYINSLKQLCQELALPVPQLETSMSLLRRERDLRVHVEELTKQRDERVDRMKTLSAVDQQLCDLLCETPYYIPRGTVPNMQQLAELQEHVNKLELEKSNRLAMYRSTKREVVVMLDCLDMVPDTSFEHDVICDEEESFLLTSDNMKQLKDYHDRLAKKQETCMQLVAELRDEVKTSWSRLGIQESDMNDFWRKNSGYKMSTIQHLQDEVKRCRQLRAQNLRQILEATRAELTQIWDKCYYSKQQRDAFLPFYSDELTEDLLDAHDRELKRLRGYYEQHKPLFEKVNKREQLWIKFLNFEQMASDPNRLFLNRGCNLLKEEKARNKLQKELPQLEQEVAEEIVAWEAATGNIFAINGQTYTTYVASQWNEYRTKKEQEKQQRLEQKAKKMELEMKYGSKPLTPHKKRFAPASNSPSTRTMSKRLRPISELDPASPWSAKRPAISPSPWSAKRPTVNPSCLFSPACATPIALSTKLLTRPLETVAETTTAHSTPSTTTTFARRPLAEHQTTASHHVDAVSDDTGFSQTTVSGVTSNCTPSSDDPDMSLAPVIPYQEFAGTLNDQVRSQCRSSLMPK